MKAKPHEEGNLPHEGQQKTHFPQAFPFAGHTDSVWRVIVTPDGKQAVSWSRDQTLKLWDLKSGQVLADLPGRIEGILAITMNSDRKRAISHSSGTLKVWDVDSGRVLLTLVGHTEDVLAVAVTPDGRCAVTGSGDKTVKVWDLESGRIYHTLTGHEYQVSAVAVTTDGRRAVSGSLDGILKVWDMESGREIHTIAGHTDWIVEVAVTPGNYCFISRSSDNTMKLWDLESGRKLHTLAGHVRGATRMAIAPDGRRAISGGRDGILKVWDLSSGQELVTLTGHTAGITAVAVTPDGRCAVTGSGDKTVKVWDLNSGRELTTFTGHTDVVNVIAITRDGKWAVSGSDDKTLKVWDLGSVDRTTGSESISSKSADYNQEILNQIKKLMDDEQFIDFPNERKVLINMVLSSGDSGTKTFNKCLKDSFAVRSHNFHSIWYGPALEIAKETKDQELFGIFVTIVKEGNLLARGIPHPPAWLPSMHPDIEGGGAFGWSGNQGDDIAKEAVEFLRDNLHSLPLDQQSLFRKATGEACGCALKTWLDVKQRGRSVDPRGVEEEITYWTDMRNNFEANDH